MNTTVYRVHKLWLDGKHTWSRPFETRRKAKEHMRETLDLAFIKDAEVCRYPRDFEPAASNR